jgi:uncharacterized protein (DUF433 family)
MGAAAERWIVSDPEVLGGKPIIKGTRLSVQLILGELARGASPDELLQEYPGLTPEGITAALEYAAEAVGDEVSWDVKLPT